MSTCMVLKKSLMKSFTLLHLKQLKNWKISIQKRNIRKHPIYSNIINNSVNHSLNLIILGSFAT